VLPTARTVLSEAAIPFRFEASTDAELKDLTGM
jgi:hypothetical protein